MSKTRSARGDLQNAQSGLTPPSRSSPRLYKRPTGSELLIIEPEYVLWVDTQQLYPFVFETVGDWDVTASITPPEGFVADHDELWAYVDNEIESVQFTIVEVGSDLVPTQTKFKLNHGHRRRTVHSKVGILLTPAYARSRGFDVASLRAKGLIKEPPGLKKREGE
ncbi:MAG: hypothetical protein JSU86_01905 [Phycisphaerales bacterium]|nr:MAG: hypothetical protein JSU86_01905 [Phycisphaerales bacterium]